MLVMATVPPWLRLSESSLLLVSDYPRLLPLSMQIMSWMNYQFLRSMWNVYHLTVTLKLQCNPSAHILSQQSCPGDGGGSGGGSSDGNDDGCDGGVMTAERNKSNQEQRLAFIIVFLYIYYFVECITCEIHYSLLRRDFKYKNSFLQNELYDGNIQFNMKFSISPFILSYHSSVSKFPPLQAYPSSWLLPSSCLYSSAHLASSVALSGRPCGAGSCDVELN